MTIKNLYPDSRPQSIYNVINGRPELPAQSTFSRASEASYVDSGGLLKTAPAGEPRFNYDPDTGEFLGLLLERGMTNYVRWSEKLDSGAGIWNINPLYEAEVSADFAIAPDGTTTADKIYGPAGVTNWFIVQQNIQLGAGRRLVVSFYAKSAGWNVIRVLDDSNQSDPRTNSYWNLDDGTVFNGISGNKSGMVDAGNGWWRCWYFTSANPSYNLRFYATNSSVGTNQPTGDGSSGVLLWGVQAEDSLGLNYKPSSYFKTEASTAVRSADKFSLTSSNNFDGGFSLLLDSDTTTGDFLYRIKANGSTIASLSNDAGTLDWVITAPDGTEQSAKIDGLYPQVGFTYGRVRTVSSYGAADGEIQNNYLYTTGLSFPTPAVVASGADELEFGVPQTLKALYLWNGQLSDTEAVSVIKGEYNVVPNEPIKTDSYSFVYNTDPTDVGETSITLPYIVPTVSERIYWGDGTNQRYEQGVTPSHTYPYPGQYRIQIEADDGFDTVRLGGDVTNAITRVDQWAPQHRAGATGGGFTGDDMTYLLAYSRTYNSTIPVFEYTDLTNMSSAFRLMDQLDAGNWEWVPVNLQSCTSLSNTFSWCGTSNPTNSGQRDKFPQLKTSSALKYCTNTFTNSLFTGFLDTDTGTTTYQPFTNTSQVTQWDGCFYSYRGLDLVVDLTAGTSFQTTFEYCNRWTSFPPGEANQNCMEKAQSVSSAWRYNEKLLSFPVMKFPNCIRFDKAWMNCVALESFPLIVTSKGENFSSAWSGCEALESFPPIDTSNGTTFNTAWSNCTGLTSFPELDTANSTDFRDAWRNCEKINNIGVVTGATTSFPSINTSSCVSFSNAWNRCRSLTNFPQIDTSSGIRFGTTWYACVSLSSFPANMFDTTGTLDSNAFDKSWQSCALTAQSIENILVSLDTNGQSNIKLGIGGGSNAAKSTWTAAAVAAFDNLIAKGWTIEFNA